MKKFEENVREIVKDELDKQMKPATIAVGGIITLGIGVIGFVSHYRNKRLDEQNELLRKQNATNTEVLDKIADFLEGINIQVNSEYEDDETDSEDSGDNEPEKK